MPEKKGYELREPTREGLLKTLDEMEGSVPAEFRSRYDLILSKLSQAGTTGEISQAVTEAEALITEIGFEEGEYSLGKESK